MYLLEVVVCWVTVLRKSDHTEHPYIDCSGLITCSSWRSTEGLWSGGSFSTSAIRVDFWASFSPSSSLILTGLVPPVFLTSHRSVSVQYDNSSKGIMDCLEVMDGFYHHSEQIHSSTTSSRKWCSDATCDSSSYCRNSVSLTNIENCYVYIAVQQPLVMIGVFFFRLEHLLSISSLLLEVLIGRLHYNRFESPFWSNGLSWVTTPTNNHQRSLNNECETVLTDNFIQG